MSSQSEKPSSRYLVRVRFGETDLMGIVHHAVYLSYFEAGRVEYMRRRGIDYVDWAKRGIHLPVVEANVRYRKMARFDELLMVETSLEAMTRVTIRFGYRILRHRDGQELVAEGFTLLACVNDQHLVTRIPEDLVTVLQGPETRTRPDNEI
mgnify:CR=1 FL=1